MNSREKKWNKIQPPEKIMDAIGLKKGMSIGDIGARGGRFSVWFADRVGKDGKVYANDIDPEALEYLKQRCKENNIGNIETVIGSLVDPGFKENSLDFAFTINTYHHLEKPVELLRNVIPSLRSNGTLAVVEHDPEKSGYPLHESTPKEEMLVQLEEAGFEVVRIESFLENDYIYICQPMKSEKCM